MSIVAPLPDTAPGTDGVWKYWARVVAGNVDRCLKTIEAVQKDAQDERVKQATRDAATEALTKEVQELRRAVELLNKKTLPGMQESITALKVKAGLWGAAAGVVPAAIAIIYAMTKAGP